MKEPPRWKAHEAEAKRSHPLAEIFAPAYRRRTIVNAALLSVAIIGLWAGAVYEPAAITTLAKKAGMDAAGAARMVSVGTGVLSLGTILGCLCLPLVAERIGRKPTLAMYFAGMMVTIPLAFGWAFYLERGLVPFIALLFVMGFAGGNFAVFSLWLPEQYDTRVRATAFAFSTSIGRFLGAGVNFALGALVLRMGTLGTPIAWTGAAFALGHPDHSVRDRDEGAAPSGVNGGSRCFCTLPSAVRGRESTRTMPRGILKLASCVRRCASSARLVERRFGDEVRDGHLAAHAVRHADDRRLAHAGLLEQQFLDLARIDVESAGDDQVAAPAFERDVAVGGALADVAGAEPAVHGTGRRGRVESGCGRVRPAPVAGADVRAAHPAARRWRRRARRGRLRRGCGSRRAASAGRPCPGGARRRTGCSRS